MRAPFCCLGGRLPCAAANNLPSVGRTSTWTRACFRSAGRCAGPARDLRSVFQRRQHLAPGGAVVLRHTAATLLLSEGEHPKVVQELLGHAQVSSTLDRYSHMTPRLMSNAAAVMDRLLDEDA
jgi:integrase